MAKFALLILLGFISTSVLGQDLDGFVSELGSQGIPITSVSFNNWGNTVSRTTVFKVSPYDKPALQTIISTAYDYQVRVRATGSTHAFSDLFTDSGQVWLDMSGYRQNEPDRIYITYPSFQRKYVQVTINPSVTMAEMVAFMASNGISLPSFPAVLSPSPMGVTATGGHGMNWLDGPVSSHLVNVQFINGEGNSRVFDVDQNGETFDVFRSHLGLCGVITEMTFRAEAWSLMSKYTDVRMSFTDLFYNVTALQLLLTENHSWLATWDIFSSLTAQQITDMASNGGVTADWVPANDSTVFVILQELEGGTSEILAAADNGTLFPVNFTLGGEFYSEGQVGYGFYPELGELDPVEENSQPIHCEFGFSVNERTFAQVIQILEILLSEMRSYALSHSTVPLQSVQFAFYRHNTSCLLCHSNVADSSVNANRQTGELVFMVNFVLESEQITEFETLIATIYASWKAANLQGLPHFGKYIPDVADITDDIITKLAPKITTFRTLREDAGLDGIDLFTNDFIDAIIFPDKVRVLRDASSSGTASLTVSAVCVAVGIVSAVMGLWRVRHGTK